MVEAYAAAYWKQSKCLRADVKVVVALNGGIDSSVVAAMVNHLIREGEKVGGRQ